MDFIPLQAEDAPATPPTRIKPAQILVYGYLTLIFAGTILLSLPAASAGSASLHLIDALFMATSAVAVTGLTVVSTANDLSFFGQIVVMILIQFGALGIMTMSSLFMLLLGRRISLRDRLMIREDLNQSYLSGLVRLVRSVVGVTLIIEGIGVLLLAIQLVPLYGWGRGMFFSLFHAVSAFGNAGFDLFGNSLESFTGHLGVTGIIALLFIVGGLGFSVISEILTYPSRHRFSLHSRVVLQTTLYLIVGGWIVIFLLEQANPQTLGGLPLGQKLVASFFQAVTPRTAGFNSVPTASLTETSLFFVMLLMFIGASPGSTGGGVKTTTFGTLWAGVTSTIQGRRDIVMFERRLPQGAVARALTIAVLSALLVTVMTILLLTVEHRPLLASLFEVVSAFGTVGLSTGITSGLSVAGKLIIIVTMFVGRLGPMTLALAIGQRSEKEMRVRYPEETVSLG